MRRLLRHARRKLGLSWRRLVLKRIFRVGMRVLRPWVHGAAQHVGRELDPRLVRTLLCMLFTCSFLALILRELSPRRPYGRRSFDVLLGMRVRGMRGVRQCILGQSRRVWPEEFRRWRFALWRLFRHACGSRLLGRCWLRLQQVCEEGP